MRTTAVVSLIAIVGCTNALMSNRDAGASAPSRIADPIVITGADTPTLVGSSPGTIVGFRRTSGAWAQIPIQIDERAIVNFSKIYHDPIASFYGSQVNLVSTLVYTSTNTWTGADPDPKFDNNDELAFMARDAGNAAAPGTAPPVGARAGTGVEVHVTDPLAPANDSYIYLFNKIVGSTLVPGAHVKYVNYTFKLLSGAYKPTYGLTGANNLENSTVKGATYTRHFSNRWLTDQLMISAPGASKVDILDRNKVLFAPNFCVRSEDTFDASGPNGTAEGAFIVNKTGPIRAIRSYVGANSGPSTQRTHIFYDRREDIRSDLRVHAIPSVIDFVDYSAAAVGMTYRNSTNPGGVTIDGNPESLTAGANLWEQVAGPQGTVTYVTTSHASFTPSVTSWYEDNSTTPTTQCTGDAFAYGASGNYINATIPCTDPGLGCTDSFDTTRTILYEAPGGTAASADSNSSAVVQPLQFATKTWQ